MANEDEKGIAESMARTVCTYYWRAHDRAGDHRPDRACARCRRLVFGDLYSLIEQLLFVAFLEGTDTELPEPLDARALVHSIATRCKEVCDERRERAAQSDPRIFEAHPNQVPFGLRSRELGEVSGAETERTRVDFKWTGGEPGQDGFMIEQGDVLSQLGLTALRDGFLWLGLRPTVSTAEARALVDAMRRSFESISFTRLHRDHPTIPDVS